MAASETASQTGQINQDYIYGVRLSSEQGAIAFAPVQTASHATELVRLG